MKSHTLLLLYIAGFVTVQNAHATGSSMSFFITRVGSGNAGALAGMEGDYTQCKSLAESAGVTGKMGLPTSARRRKTNEESLLEVVSLNF